MKLLKYDNKGQSIYIVPSSIIYFQETNYGTQVYFHHDTSLLINQKIENVVKDYVVAMDGKP